jgi:hypothetical protein
MRLTMRPVSLSRVAETAFFAEKTKKFTKEDLAAFLKSSERRAKEVSEETVNIGFLDKEETIYTPTKRCTQFLENIRKNDWKGIHEQMLDYSFYKTFYKILQSIEPATPEEILESLSIASIPFNEASRHVLCDWGERIGSVQRNIFTNQYFTIIDAEIAFAPAFLETYQLLNLKTGLSLRQRYIEIPRVREYVCQKLRISRENFDTRFLQLCLKNIGKIELAGAPVTTHAKQSAKKVKSVHFLEFPDTITMKLSSNQFLNGLNVGKKSYYFIAYHGGELND